MMVSPYTDEALYGRPQRFSRIEHTIVWASGGSSMRPAVLDRAQNRVARFIDARNADDAYRRLLENGNTLAYVWRPVDGYDVLNGEDKEVK